MHLSRVLAITSLVVLASCGQSDREQGESAASTNPSVAQTSSPPPTEPIATTVGVSDTPADSAVQVEDDNETESSAPGIGMSHSASYVDSDGYPYSVDMYFILANCCVNIADFPPGSAGVDYQTVIGGQVTNLEQERIFPGVSRVYMRAVARGGPIGQRCFLESEDFGTVCAEFVDVGWSPDPELGRTVPIEPGAIVSFDDSANRIVEMPEAAADSVVADLNNNVIPDWLAAWMVIVEDGDQFRTTLYQPDGAYVYSCDLSNIGNGISDLEKCLIGGSGANFFVNPDQANLTRNF